MPFEGNIAKAKIDRSYWEQTYLTSSTFKSQSHSPRSLLSFPLAKHDETNAQETTMFQLHDNTNESQRSKRRLRETTDPKNTKLCCGARSRLILFVSICMQSVVLHLLLVFSKWRTRASAIHFKFPLKMNVELGLRFENLSRKDHVGLWDSWNPVLFRT